MQEVMVQYDRRVSTAITMAILRHPHHLNAQILPKEDYYWNFLQDARDYMASKEEGKHGNKHYQGFFDWELDTMDRFIDYTKKHPTRKRLHSRNSKKRL